MEPRSTRLNNSLRSAFVRTVMADVMPDTSIPTMEDFQKEHAVMAYEATYGKYKEQIQALPREYTVKTNIIFVSLDGKPVAFIQPNKVTAFMKYTGSSYDYLLHNSDCGLPFLPVEHPITQAYKQRLQEMKDWRLKVTELRNQLTTLVEGCNTSGQLYKAWPTAIKFAGCFPYVAPEKGGKPDITGEELDIGLALSQLVVTGIIEN